MKKKKIVVLRKPRESAKVKLNNLKKFVQEFAKEILEAIGEEDTEDKKLNHIRNVCRALSFDHLKKD
jgi:ribosomal protein L7/L12